MSMERPWRSTNPIVKHKTHRYSWAHSKHLHQVSKSTKATYSKTQKHNTSKLIIKLLSTTVLCSKHKNYIKWQNVTATVKHSTVWDKSWKVVPRSKLKRNRFLLFRASWRNGVKMIFCQSFRLFISAEFRYPTINQTSSIPFAKMWRNNDDEDRTCVAQNNALRFSRIFNAQNSILNDSIVWV